MGHYRDKTKEELLHIIYELETKIERYSVRDELYKMKFSNSLIEQCKREKPDIIPDVIKVFDYDGNCVELTSVSHINQTENLSLKQSCSCNFLDKLHKDGCDIVRSNLEEVKRTKKTRMTEYSLQMKDGKRYYESRISPLGERFLLCICRDVTNRINSESRSRKQHEEIKRLHSLMKVVLDNIPVYLFVKDAKDNFRYLYWNKAFAKYSGIPAEKAVGRTDFDIFTNSEDLIQFRRDDIETMELGFKEIEGNYITADGDKRVVHTTKLAVNIPNGDSYLIGISWDITDLKRTEKDLIDARKHAEESDRLKSAFLANMSHEIRTPLNAIVGFSRLVAAPGNEGDKESYSAIIERNTDLLLHLFDDIIDLSVLEAGGLTLFNEELNLYAVCTRKYNEFRNKPSKGVKFILDDVDQKVCIFSDRGRLDQILVNLLSNAVKFTSSGEIRFGYEQRGNVVQFYVKDTGIGIPSNRIATIFQRFGKVNNFSQGTGLGLTICRMLLERMGGHIWARSTEGVGTVFYFTLPLNVSSESE